MPAPPPLSEPAIVSTRGTNLLPSPVLTGSGSTGVISAADTAPRCAEASIVDMRAARYDGLADDYAAFLDEHPQYYRLAADALARLLGEGDGECLDVGCGTGHFVPVAAELGWTVTGTDISSDQLDRARSRLHRRRHSCRPTRRSCRSRPQPSTRRTRRSRTPTSTTSPGRCRRPGASCEPGGRLVYVGNHPAFVGATQEHGAHGLPRLHPGYRRFGRWDVRDAPGTTADGWRARLGSFVHVPLAPFLEAFRGLALQAVEELDDGFDYPKTIALAWTKPYGE